MAKGAIRVDWFPGEALAGMQFLTVMEELAYRRIIDLIYTNGGELPDDDDVMAEQTRTFGDWGKVKAGLVRKGKIIVADGSITNEKCTEILTLVAQKSEAARASGKASGAKRRKLLPTDDERTFNDGSNECSNERSTDAPTDGATDRELSQVVKKVVRDTDVSLTAGVSAISFEDFAKAFPRADAINAARPVWNKLVEDGIDPADIMAGLNSWLPIWKSRIADPKDSFAEQHVRSAVRWLNECGWMDPVTVTDTPKSVPEMSIRWDGPDAIREAVEIEFGKEFALSYLLMTARWNEPSTILTKTQYAADQLKRVTRLRSYKIEKEA